MRRAAAPLLMPAIAPPLAISPQDLHTLGQWSRSGSIRAALVERAKILLLAAEGLSNTEIASQVGCSRPTVILWRHRYTQAGLDGLVDKPRTGRPQTVRAHRPGEIPAPPLTPATPTQAWAGRLTSLARVGPRPSAPTGGPRSWPPPSPHHPSTWGSRTGRPGCWATSSGAATTPWPGSGATSDSSPRGRD